MRKVWGCTEMSAALFDLDNDGTMEILISRANIKKITRVTVAEPGRKTAKIFLPDPAADRDHPPSVHRTER